MSDDKINISKEELFSERISDEKISALAKMTAKQIYNQGYQAGEMADKTDIWNEAIEAAAKLMKDRFDNNGWNYHFPSVGREAEYEIRKLKK